MKDIDCNPDQQEADYLGHFIELRTIRIRYLAAKYSGEWHGVLGYFLPLSAKGQSNSLTRSGIENKGLVFQYAPQSSCTPPYFVNTLS